MLAYNSATKMKEIPVPFAYVQARHARSATDIRFAAANPQFDALLLTQFNSLLLIVFFFTAPIGMAALGFSVAEDPDSSVLMAMVIFISPAQKIDNSRWGQKIASNRKGPLS